MQLKNAAAQNYYDVLAVAEAKQVESAALISQADKATGDERSRLMFDAGIAKLKAQTALTQAQNSKALIDLDYSGVLCLAHYRDSMAYTQVSAK